MSASARPQRSAGLHGRHAQPQPAGDEGNDPFRRARIRHHGPSRGRCLLQRHRRWRFARFDRAHAGLEQYLHLDRASRYGVRRRWRQRRQRPVALRLRRERLLGRIHSPVACQARTRMRSPSRAATTSKCIPTLPMDSGNHPHQDEPESDHHEWAGWRFNCDAIFVIVSINISSVTVYIYAN